MADWEKPNNSEPVHVNVLRDLAEKDTHTGTMGQSGTYTNRPEGFMIWDNIAKLFKRLTIGVETIIQLSIAGGGTGGATAAEARANLGANEEGTGATQTRTNAENDTVYTPLTRTVSTSGALSGGGSFDSDLTLEIADSTTAQKGAVQLNNTLTSTATDKALTAAQGKVLKDSVDTLQEKHSLIFLWTGSASQVTENMIFAFTGNLVIAGEYYITTLTAPSLQRTYTVSKPASSLATTATGSSKINGNRIHVAEWGGGGQAFSVDTFNMVSGLPESDETIIEMYYKPF